MKELKIEGITQPAYDRLARDLSTMIDSGAGHLMMCTIPHEARVDYVLLTRPEIVVITRDQVSINMRSEDGLDIPISLRHSEYSKLVF